MTIAISSWTRWHIGCCLEVLLTVYLANFVVIQLSVTYVFWRSSHKGTTTSYYEIYATNEIRWSDHYYDISLFWTDLSYIYSTSLHAQDSSFILEIADFKLLLAMSALASLLVVVEQKNKRQRWCVISSPEEQNMATVALDLDVHYVPLFLKNSKLRGIGNSYETIWERNGPRL